MIYRVVVDGANFYDETLDRTLINPSVDVELNSAGSFDFTIPPNHDLYSSIHLLTSDVEVYEDGDIIFFGRPIEIKTDFYNQKHVHCEGGLAYFNDSIVGPTTLDSVTGRTVEYENVSIKEIFRKIIDSHNRQVPANRQFTVGRIEVADKLVYRLFNYETCKDALSKFCLETTGGYLQTRRVAGVNYIDWLRVLDNNHSDQPVRYALNITDIEQKLDGADIKTGIIPLGAETDGVKLNIQTVNAGSDRLLSDAAQTYGEILQVVEFSDITTAQELKEKGLEWLADEQFEGLSVEVNAAELSYLDESYHHFQVGQTVHCVSNPHLLDKNFPITKLSLSLDSAVKTLTIGTQKKQKLTEIYKAADGSVYTASSSYNGSGGSSAGGSSIGSTSLSGSAGGGSGSSSSGTTVVANPEGSPTDELNTIQIGSDIYEIVGGGGSGSGSGSGYTATLLHDCQGSPSLSQVTLSDSWKNYDALYIEVMFNGEAYTGSAKTRETLQQAADNNMYVGCVSFGNTYVGLNRLSNDGVTLSFYGQNTNGVTRIFGLKYGSGGGTGGGSYGEEVIFTGSNSDSSPITLLKDINEFDLIQFVVSYTDHNTTCTYEIPVKYFVDHYPYSQFSSIATPNLTIALAGSEWFRIARGQTDTQLQFMKGNNFYLKNVIGIKTGGSGSSSSLEEYSTTEKVIGKWIDGRNIYQITIGDETTPVSQQDLSSLNIDFTIDIDGIFGDSNLGLSQCTYTTTTSSTTTLEYGYVTYTKSTHMLNIVNRNGYVYCVTLKYTKTTD